MRLTAALIWTFLLVFVLFPLTRIFYDAFTDEAGAFTLLNFREFFTDSFYLRSFWKSMVLGAMAVVTTSVIGITVAFLIVRYEFPYRNLFSYLTMLPLILPPLVGVLGFIFILGRAGTVNVLLYDWFGLEQPVNFMYGMHGILLVETVHLFPMMTLSILDSLSKVDPSLEEAAQGVGAKGWRRFFTITLPGCKYGLLSAATVVFTYTISDFGAPKVIGGNFNVLAVDVFKQVIGQHNFSIGAVVGLLLLVPSVIAFAIDWVVRRRLTASLGTRSVPFVPKRRPLFDTLMLAYCAIVCLLLLAVLGMAVYTSLIHLWPYNLGFTFKHYRYALVAGDYAPAFWNSLKMGAWTAVIGTVFVFCTAYLLEKTRGLGPLRPVLRLLALLSMAVPGLVLGLGYIMFFNHPQNPLNFLYQTMAILAISTVVHYYTSGHLTAVTALKALDDEYESVSASLKVPFYKTFWRVTVPVCLPAILEIARYYFVVSISTLSCVVFLYAPHTILAAVAIMNMDEAGDIGPAAALGTLVVLASIGVCLLYSLATRVLVARSQAWRLLNPEKP